MIIDDKLGWLDHINSINIKLSRSLYILNSVKNMLPNDILRQLYYTGAAVFNLWCYPMGIYVPVVLKTDSYSSEEGY